MENSRRDWLILLGLCLLGMVLGRLQDGARDGGRPDFVTSAVHTAVRPAAASLTSAVNALADARDGMFSGGVLVQRNRRLEQQVRAAAMYDSQVARLQQEVDSLRRMLDLPEVQTRHRIAADVIGYFPRESRMTINAGQSKGVRKGSPVVTGDGLVGIVSTVSGSQAQVLLLSHSQLQIGALTEGGVAGLLRGETVSSLLMEVPDMSAQIMHEQLVLTAGFSEKIPKGIPIGRIYEVENDVEFGRKLARLRPTVQMGAIREVLVLQ